MPSKLIESSEVILTTPGGSTITVLHLTEEARVGLTVGGTEEEPGEKPYRFRAKEGDRVRLPDGREGVLYMIEFVAGGNVMVASIRPDKPKRRFFRLLPAIPVRLADEEIDRLVLLPSEEEIRRIMDDPVALGLEP